MQKNSLYLFQTIIHQIYQIQRYQMSIKNPSKMQKNAKNYDYPLQRNISQSTVNRESCKKLKKTFDTIKSNHEMISQKKAEKDIIVSQYIKVDEYLREDTNQNETNQIIKDQYFEYDLPCKKKEYLEYQPVSTYTETEQNRPMLVKNLFFQSDDHEDCINSPLFPSSARKDNLDSKPNASERLKTLEDSSLKYENKTRKNIESIYDRLIRESQSKKNKIPTFTQSNECRCGNNMSLQAQNSKQATFEPKNLKKQLQSYRNWEIRHENSKKNAQYETQRKTVQKNQTPKSEKRMNRHNSEMQFISKRRQVDQAKALCKQKTKYQRILQQYFSTSNRKGNEMNGVEEKNTTRQKSNFSLKKSESSINCKSQFKTYCQIKKRNSISSTSIHKSYQKQNLSHQKKALLTENSHHTTKNKETIRKNVIERLQKPKNQNKYQIDRSSKLNQKKKDPSYSFGKYNKKSVFPEQNYPTSHQYSENSQIFSTINKKQQSMDKKVNEKKAERWMEMGFHERQKKILQSRLQKQQMGIRQKLQKQIKPCTFKPQVSNKSTNMIKQSVKRQQKPSYLQHYYEKLSKKY